MSCITFRLVDYLCQHAVEVFISRLKEGEDKMELPVQKLVLFFSDLLICDSLPIGMQFCIGVVVKRETKHSIHLKELLIQV